MKLTFAVKDTKKLCLFWFLFIEYRKSLSPIPHSCSCAVTWSLARCYLAFMAVTEKYTQRSMRLVTHRFVPPFAFLINIPGGADSLDFSLIVCGKQIED